MRSPSAKVRPSEGPQRVDRPLRHIGKEVTLPPLIELAPEIPNESHPLLDTTVKRGSSIHPAFRHPDDQVTLARVFGIFRPAQALNREVAHLDCTDSHFRLERPSFSPTSKRAPFADVRRYRLLASTP